MATPKTLLQLAGVPTSLPNVNDTALLIIDMQNEYLSTGKVPLHNVDKAFEKGKQILQLAREKKVLCASHTYVSE